jgi:translocation and assembly module TamB
VRPPRRWLRATAWAAGRHRGAGRGRHHGAWWWAGTDGSLATALRWIGRSQPLSAERVTGSLRAGGHVDQLVWQQDGLRVDVRDVTLAWQPWSLLHGTLKVNRLAAASVQVNDQRPPSTTPSVPPSALGLPLPVVLDGFSIGQFQWTGASVFRFGHHRQLCVQGPGPPAGIAQRAGGARPLQRQGHFVVAQPLAARCQPGGCALTP